MEDNGTSAGESESTAAEQPLRARIVAGTIATVRQSEAFAGTDVDALARLLACAERPSAAEVIRILRSKG